MNTQFKMDFPLSIPYNSIDFAVHKGEKTNPRRCCCW